MILLFIFFTFHNTSINVEFRIINILCYLIYLFKQFSTFKIQLQFCTVKYNSKEVIIKLALTETNCIVYIAKESVLQIITL